MNWSHAHATDIQMRFGDVDSLGHVNNVAYAQYLETARIGFLNDLARRGVDFHLVIARLEVDYRHEVTLGQHVTVQLLVTRVGRTSFECAYRVLANGVLAAEARSVQVNVDRAARRPQPLEGHVRAALLERLAMTGLETGTL
ncbi:acyl-CoA thioesterase [Deinococcus peraridilitoris]|uniref:Putative thioesterase n=1 Tax=Deinococcus peraridilitoris (strain DSM 19664 / LMG 22246 / CIP 109416 / KR-200) TaxID=937777 RepID=L0A095_DEIPD|nr:thioesterase family protein [Deinococcus peraridilitoris]AFZ66874.1 putative thioesterase [Deinococcus peraridilitoris DSM 19664]